MLPWIDIAIIVVYMIASVGVGCWFYFASRSPEGFTTANGRAPGIIVGLSIFGTYVSSISFLALPGKAFVGNWNAYGLSLSIPLAAWIATKWFVPFYRNVGREPRWRRGRGYASEQARFEDTHIQSGADPVGSVSAYAHLEERFGTWARVYASGCYLLTQVARMGSVLFLLALPLNHLLGWDVRWIIIVVGASAALYSMIGGITGILWTDALQSVVLIVGALTCALILVFQMPEGPRQLFEIAQQNDKFSLGSFSVTDFCSSTFWVVLLYGLTINLQNFGIDQNYVQRYLTSPTERQAKNSVWLGALLYLPISAFFFFIGTALFAFYTAQPNLITDPQLAADVADGKGDGVFPYFIVHQLPVGMTGLLIAAILAAAMSTISSSVNGASTLTLTDYYKRFFRPAAGEKEQMLVLYLSSLIWGALGIGCALLMISAKGVLDAYWNLMGIFSGGMVGLFLLGFLSRRATSKIALVSAIVGVTVILWMTASLPRFGIWPERFAAFRCPLNELMITVCGTAAILVTGFALTMLLTKRKQG